MNWAKHLIAGLAVICVSMSAPAATFKKTPKGDPVQRVPQLLEIVKSEADDKKRAAAAQELREYDSTQFPEIVPVLADVVHSDKSAVVRLEAVQSLGKIRPVSATAGQALEHAVKDAARRVRVQAWTSLRLYQLAGYRSGPREAKPPFHVEVLNLDVQERPKLGLFRGAVKTNPPPTETPAQPPSNEDIPRPLPSAGPPFSTAIVPHTPRVSPPPVTAEPPR